MPCPSWRGGGRVSLGEYWVEVEQSSGFGGFRALKVDIWEFPKIRGSLFWGPYTKNSTI